MARRVISEYTASLLPGSMRTRFMGVAGAWGFAEMLPVAKPGPGKIRLLIAPTNSASQAYYWARAAESLPGVSARNLMFGYRPTGITVRPDVGVSKNVGYYSRAWALRQRRQIFKNFTHVIYESQRPILPSLYGGDVLAEIADLQDHGIKVAMLAHGSDVRTPSEHVETEPYSPFSGPLDGLTEALEEGTAKRRQILAALDLPEFVSTPDLLRYLPGAQWLPTLTDPQRWLALPPSGLGAHRLRVLHIPSRSALKGTTHIRSAMRRLEQRDLKQVNLFKDEFEVTTCGYGHTPVAGVKHIEIPIEAGMWRLNGRIITLKQYRRVYWSLDGVDWVWNKLRGRLFDAIIANDYDTVPIAVRLKPKGGVHADLHEFAPSQGEENEAWKRRTGPWRAWVLRKYATKAQSWTTVSPGLADRFHADFGFRPQLVTNAAPYADLQPTEVHEPLRLVYHGAANRNRNIDQMIQAVSASEASFVFDLYIPRSSSGWMDTLEQIAAPDPRITVHDAVPYAELIPLLNTYDVGISVLPPNTFNLLHALPNKVFDCVQARIATLTGPSPAMADLVRANDLGLVLPDFEPNTLTRAIDGLKASEVQTWKANADLVAWDLSSANQNAAWLEPVRALARRARH